MPAQCPRCLELEDELHDMRQRMASAGLVVDYTPGPNYTLDLERELHRWLAVSPRADAAAGFRAGWDRLARFVRPKLLEWESRWQRAMRENDSLKSRIGVLIMDNGRLTDRG